MERDVVGAVTDEVLMVRFRDCGDYTCYDELYRKYRPRIYAYEFALTRQDAALAEDLTQETFCRVIDKKDAFDPLRGTFCAWVYKMATNLTHDFRRQVRRAATVTLDVIIERLVEPSPTPLHVLITECLDELDDVDRKIILLTAIEGFTFTEVARILNKPIGTIGRRRFKALRKLRGMLGAPAALAPKTTT
jgi:RNA polymerase sigma-70 factor (ECF subfamily)